MYQSRINPQGYNVTKCKTSGNLNMTHPKAESPHYNTLVTILTNENKRGKSPETPKKSPYKRFSTFAVPRVIKVRSANLGSKCLILFTFSKQLKI
jgi:hypothetical protein